MQYVEALQVDSRESIAERTGAEVYRFAISGAPLSQYLLMLEREVMDYAPDIVVIVLVHNDFDESFLFHPGRYTSSFLKLDIEDGRVIGEIPPAPYRPDWKDRVRQLATMRYLYYRQQVSPTALRNALLGARAHAGADEPDATGGPAFEANVPTGRLVRHWTDIEAATAYLYDRIVEVVRETDAKLVMVMDGHRHAIYRGEDGRGSIALELNRMAARMAAERDIPFLDLHEVFTADWEANGERFEFFRDSH